MTTPRPNHVSGRTLRDLATRLGSPFPADADPSLVLTGITLDSRAVQPGDVYAALTGRLAHGADFEAALRPYERLCLEWYLRAGREHAGADREAAKGLTLRERDPGRAEADQRRDAERKQCSEQ